MLDKAAEAPIDGTVGRGFEEVEAVFRRNFRERNELGAACAVYHEGEKVVDMWGGYRDIERRLPWQEDTLVLVYSTTKGLAGMTMAVANSRGFLDYDDKVAAYWPEFAQGGKESITVRQLLSHQAGLSGLDKPLDLKTIADRDALAATIARQEPAWEPGTRHGYHGISLGWYEGELIRRVDPEHRSLGRFFEDEIALPLGLEFYIGVPPGVPDSRVAEIKAFRPAQMLFHMNTMPAGMVLALMDAANTDDAATLDDGGSTNAGDVDSRDGVKADTISERQVPDTGGMPLFGFVVPGLAFVGVGLLLFRSAMRRNTYAALHISVLRSLHPMR